MTGLLGRCWGAAGARERYTVGFIQQFIMYTAGKLIAYPPGKIVRLPGTQFPVSTYLVICLAGRGGRAGVERRGDDDIIRAMKISPESLLRLRESTPMHVDDYPFLDAIQLRVITSSPMDAPWVTDLGAPYSHQPSCYHDNSVASPAPRVGLSEKYVRAAGSVLIMNYGCNYLLRAYLRHG